jgi:hypothetical protein
MTSLLALPNELLQNVVYHLPFSALVNLQCVNRRLQDVCRDRSVLQNVVRYGFDNTPGAVDSLIGTYSAPGRIRLESEELEWHEADLLLEDSDLEEVTKVAYVLDRCIRFTMDHRGDKVGILCAAPEAASSNIFIWLPVFLALHHPLALALDSSYCLFDAHRQASMYLVAGHADEDCVASVVNLSFVIAFIALERFRRVHDHTETLRLFEEVFVPGQWAANPGSHRSDFEERHTIYAETISEMRKLVPNYGEQHNPFPQSGAATVLLILIYQLAYAQLFPETASQFENEQLPVPSKITFHKFMDIESVFENPAARFDMCHIRGMTSPDFLSSGPWKGYYTDERMRDYRGIESNGTLLDPPMFDINIVARELSPHDTTARGARTKIDRQTRGTDSHGEFRLEGRVYADGSVDIVKTYLIGDTSWVWTGQVTTFGIIGHWGNHWQFGGYFWIWKGEWM